MASTDVGQLIRRKRLALGWTQFDLANQVAREVSDTTPEAVRSWLSLVESGRRQRPDPNMLRWLARPLDIPVETLLSAAGYDTERPAPRERTLSDLASELMSMAAESPVVLTVERPPGADEAGASEGERVAIVPAPHERGHRFAAYAVASDVNGSRAPRGSVVVVDRSRPVESGDLVAIVVDGMLVMLRAGEEAEMYGARAQPLGVVVHICSSPSPRRAPTTPAHGAPRISAPRMHECPA